MSRKKRGHLVYLDMYTRAQNQVNYVFGVSYSFECTYSRGSILQRSLAVSWIMWFKL